VLRACGRVLKPGGRIGYFNIFIPHEVPEMERRRLRRESPWRYTRAEQQGLLRSAGFVRIEEQDVTDEYLRIQRALYEANARHERSLLRVQGAAQFEQRQMNRRRTLEQIERGVLRRSLLLAQKPPRSPARRGPPRPAGSAP
jgi:hypothetical protein